MARRRDLGISWWANSWLDALERRALADPNRLPRGRTYARRGAVLDLGVGPGLIEARVQGSRRTPYRAHIGLREFTEDDWAAAFEVIAARVGFIAALEDGTVPPELAEALADRGVDLFPRAGELTMRCSCPDWAVPCKHLAAACYVVADRLDDQPFELLLLRGRSQSQVVEALRTVRAGAVEDADVIEPGPAVMAARDLWAGGSAGDGEGPGRIAQTARIARGRTPRRSSSALAAWEEFDDRLSIDVLDAANRARDALVGRPIDCDLPADVDAVRLMVNWDDDGASERAGLDVYLADALGVAWTAGGPRCVTTSFRLADNPPALDDELVQAARSKLAAAGVEVRRSTGYLKVSGRPLRLMPTRAFLDTDTKNLGEPWAVLTSVRGHWVVIDIASIEIIAENLAKSAG